MKSKSLPIANFFFLTAMLGVVCAPVVVTSDAWAKRGSLTISQRIDFYKQKVKFRSEKSAAKAGIKALTQSRPSVERAYGIAKAQLMNSTRNLDSYQRSYDAQRKVEVDSAARDGTAFVEPPALRRQGAALAKAKAHHENGPVKNAASREAIFQQNTTALANQRAALNTARQDLATRKANKNAARATNLAAAEAKKAARRAARNLNNQQIGAVAGQVFPPIPQGIGPPAAGANGIYLSLPSYAGNPNQPAPQAPAGVYGAAGSALSGLP